MSGTQGDVQMLSFPHLSFLIYQKPNLINHDTVWADGVELKLRCKGIITMAIPESSPLATLSLPLACLAIRGTLGTVNILMEKWGKALVKAFFNKYREMEEKEA